MDSEEVVVVDGEEEEVVVVRLVVTMEMADGVAAATGIWILSFQ